MFYLVQEEEKQCGKMLLLVVEFMQYHKETKRSKSLELNLNLIHIPNNFELKEIGRMFPPNFLHQSWNDYLYWDSELEP